MKIRGKEILWIIGILKGSIHLKFDLVLPAAINFQKTILPYQKMSQRPLKFQEDQPDHLEWRQAIYHLSLQDMEFLKHRLSQPITLKIWIKVLPKQDKRYQSNISCLIHAIQSHELEKISQGILKFQVKGSFQQQIIQDKILNQLIPEGKLLSRLSCLHQIGMLRLLETYLIRLIIVLQGNRVVI